MYVGSFGFGLGDGGLGDGDGGWLFRSGLGGTSLADCGSVLVALGETFANAVDRGSLEHQESLGRRQRFEVKGGQTRFA